MDQINNALGPDGRTDEEAAEAASAKKLEARFRAAKQVVRRYHVPQWNQNGTLTWHVVQKNANDSFTCGSCNRIWNDRGQGIRRSILTGSPTDDAEACYHIGQVAVAGRLPFVEDATEQGSVKVFRPPALWVEQQTARINEGITRQITDRQRLQEYQIRAQREEERRREAEDRDLLQRTQIMQQIVTEVERMPQWERPNIQRAIDGLVEQLRRRPVAQHLPPLAVVLNTLRGPLTTESKYQAIHNLLEIFTPVSHRSMIRNPDGSFEPLPTPQQVHLSEVGVYWDINRITRESLAENFFAESPFQRALGDVARTGAGTVSTRTPKPQPPKPTGHRFSTKRKFKLPEEQK